MAPSRHAHDRARKGLRALGLSWPDTATSSPWPEHLDLVVKGKTFAFLNVDGQPLRTSLKLPTSQVKALELPFATPAGYGLAKSGWVAIHIQDGDDVPFDLLASWLLESYRAQAPKSLLKRLDEVSAEAAAQKAAKSHATARKKSSSAQTRQTKSAATRTRRSK